MQFSGSGTQLRAKIQTQQVFPVPEVKLQGHAGLKEATTVSDNKYGYPALVVLN